MPRAVIVDAARTPIGKFGGGFSELSSVDLGVAVVRGLLSRTGVAPEAVDQVILGNARQAGAGPNPARQIAVAAGLPHETLASTLNMACASGLLSIATAADAIVAGDAEVCIAGGTESMSGLPYYLPRARFGYRMGHAPIVDGMYKDGFQCPISDQLMGRTAENLAWKYDISREQQDEWAVLSQSRCEAAVAADAFAGEIVPVTVKGRKGEVVVDADEHPRAGVTIEKMARLKPVFKEDGTVHPGNASGITDGAAAVIVMSEERAQAMGLEPMAVIEGHARAGVDPAIMGIGPVPATAKLFEKLNLTFDDIGLCELNEAFAAQVLACLAEWPLSRDIVNVNGGSIALGHPIGATGARIVATLLHAMKARKIHRGLATLCVSGGFGMSMALVRD